VADVREAREERGRFLGLGKAPARSFTYKEYCSWDEDIRCELIDGIVYMMSAPGAWHQFTALEMARQLGNWLEDKDCGAYIAPFDVRLFPPQGDDDGSDTIVVQPDVLVVCDPEKLADGKACKGAPDFVVEVTSKGTKSKDFSEKKSLYERAGVREYWIVDKNEVYCFALEDGKYKETAHDLEEALEIEVGVLPGCKVGFGRIAAQDRRK